METKFSNQSDKSCRLPYISINTEVVVPGTLQNSCSENLKKLLLTQPWWNTKLGKLHAFISKFHKYWTLPGCFLENISKIFRAFCIFISLFIPKLWTVATNFTYENCRLSRRHEHKDIKNFGKLYSEKITHPLEYFIQICLKQFSHAHR